MADAILVFVIGMLLVGAIFGMIFLCMWCICLRCRNSDSPSVSRGRTPVRSEASWSLAAGDAVQLDPDFQNVAPIMLVVADAAVVPHGPGPDAEEEGSDPEPPGGLPIAPHEHPEFQPDYIVYYGS